MENTVQNIRRWLHFFIIMLVISGLTAIPLQSELEWACRFFPPGSIIGNWLDQVRLALRDTNARYPFLAYGYDWLAFAHFAIAILIAGIRKDPVRNKWVLEFAFYTCLLIIPYALVAGHFRGIPLWWRLVDCSFGIFGLVPLLICLRQVHHLESLNSNTA